MPVRVFCVLNRVVARTDSAHFLQRQSRSSRPASRPAPASAPAQTRGAHTAAAPAHGSTNASHAPPVPPQAHSQAPSQPGMLAQMAATAGSVAVGSTIGHGLSNMLFGGSSSQAAEAAPATQATPVQQSYQAQGASCEAQAKGKFTFTRNVIVLLT